MSSKQKSKQMSKEKSEQMSAANFDDYLNDAWQSHATKAAQVAANLQVGVGLAKNVPELVRLAGLATHLFGEHLGQWGDGIHFLESLRAHSAFGSESEIEKTLERSIAALQIGGGESPSLKHFTVSDQIRVKALAAVSLVERNVVLARKLFEESLDLAKTAIDNHDPAHRALAVTGNNLACGLEEKSIRSAEETELMLLSARAARTHWERAGGWLEVSRAEYRLALSYLSAKHSAPATTHAELCLKLCLENKASDVDMFFAYEALARAAKFGGEGVKWQSAVDHAKAHFVKLSGDDKSWCESSLKALCD